MLRAPGKLLCARQNHRCDPTDPFVICPLDPIGPRLPDATASIAMMWTAGDDEKGHWRTDFEPEEHWKPRVTEPSTPLQTGNEEVDFGVTRPQEEGLGLSPIRDTARA